MLCRHCDRAAVLGGHLVQVRDALDERGAVGQCGTVEREDGHWLACCGQGVYSLVPAF